MTCCLLSLLLLLLMEMWALFCKSRVSLLFLEVSARRYFQLQSAWLGDRNGIRGQRYSDGGHHPAVHRKRWPGPDVFNAEVAKLSLRKESDGVGQRRGKYSLILQLVLVYSRPFI